MDRRTRTRRATWAGVLAVTTAIALLEGCLEGRCPDAYDYVEGCGCQERGFTDSKCYRYGLPNPSPYGDATPSDGGVLDGARDDASDAADVQDARPDDGAADADIQEGGAFSDAFSEGG